MAALKKDMVLTTQRYEEARVRKSNLEEQQAELKAQLRRVNILRHAGVMVPPSDDFL